MLQTDEPDLESWLDAIELLQYVETIKEYGYNSLEVLRVATEEDIVEMTEDADVKMKKPHRRLFVVKWKEL
eukprot:COSAG04_NODE_960_length_9157_cov_6.389269_5_plen_71_part_00